MTANGELDEFGQPISASASTVETWRAAYASMLHFTGDPIAALAAANSNDKRFVMGPVFAVAYSLLGGVNPANPSVVIELDRLVGRTPHATPREALHVDAVRLLHDGEFHQAAQRWATITDHFPGDFTAYRFVHDVCLHIGEDALRLASAQRAAEAFEPGTRAHSFAHGMLCFALEEVARYDEAAQAGHLALRHDPLDLWARHGLAHVCESTGDHEQALDLLVPTQATWAHQDLLSHHMWWHLALRLLHHGEREAASAILDDRLTGTTAFGLADATSLLWRLDLTGTERDPRWERLADGWALNGARHTCGFLDVHAAMAFASVPEHSAAERFWTGVEISHHTGNTFNDITFRDTVVDVTHAIRSYRAGDHVKASEHFRKIAPSLHRIGGSVVQRDVITRTATASHSKAAP